MNFKLSAANGLCRSARAKDLKSAIEELVDYAQINQSNATLINDDYIGSHGMAMFWGGNVKYHPFQCKFVVQAWCTGMGFVDSKHSADTAEEAEQLMASLLADDSAWLSGDRKARILLKRDKADKDPLPPHYVIEKN